MFILTLDGKYDENKNDNYVFLSKCHSSDDNDNDKMLTIERWQVDCIFVEFDNDTTQQYNTNDTTQTIRRKLPSRMTSLTSLVAVASKNHRRP